MVLQYPERGSYLTPLEFLRGIAMARLKLSPSIPVVVPIENIPHLVDLKIKPIELKSKSVYLAYALNLERTNS